MTIPRLVIAGTNSGCGKTTVTIGILVALVQKGLRVQPFKVGPDYLDPMLHYPHVYFWSNPALVTGFLAQCREYKTSKSKGNSNVTN